MKRHFALTTLLTLALAGSGLFPAQAQTYAPTYMIQDLGTLGGSWTFANAVNDSAQIVGQSLTAGGQVHAFRWDSARGMQDLLGTLGGADSCATSINNYHNWWDNRCQVCGYFQAANGQPRAFRWDTLYGMIDLGTLGGAWSQANGLNNSGWVVGMAAATNGSMHAFLWNPTNRFMQDLGTLGGTWSIASYISDNGVVVGTSSFVSKSGVADPNPHGFVWTAQQGMRDLGYFLPTYTNGSYATGNYAFISPVPPHLYYLSGQVVGNITSTSPRPLTGLYPLPGNTYSNACALSSGFVVGSSFGGMAPGCAVLWYVGRTLNLNTRIPANSGWTLNQAVGLGDAYEYIAGNGMHNGQPRAFILSLGAFAP